MKSLMVTNGANMFCRIARKFGRLSLNAQSVAYRVTNRLKGSKNKLGIYVAYYNSSVYFPAHLNSLVANTSQDFDYFVFNNYTHEQEREAFLQVVTGQRLITTFAQPASSFGLFCPLTHGESLQKMISLTSNDIIVICDVDTLFLRRGWNEFVVDELEDHDVVGVIAHFPHRSGPGQLQTVIHPSLMAFRRQYLMDNKLDIYAGDGNDPGYKVTRHLMDIGQFDQSKVSPLLASRVDFPQVFVPMDTPFGEPGLPSHGFCTTYNDLFFHFWQSRHYLEGTNILADDGGILCTHSEVKERVSHYLAPYSA